MDDGVCDCCDGSDEPKGFCQDTCDEYERQQAYERSLHSSGYAILEQRLQSDVQKKAQIKNERDESAQKVEGLDVDVTALKEKVQKFKDLEKRLKNSNENGWLIIVLRSNLTFRYL